jgi:hypothetical protein
VTPSMAFVGAAAVKVFEPQQHAGPRIKWEHFVRLHLFAAIVVSFPQLSAAIDIAAQASSRPVEY